MKEEMCVVVATTKIGDSWIVGHNAQNVFNQEDARKLAIRRNEEDKSIALNYRVAKLSWID